MKRQLSSSISVSSLSSQEEDEVALAAETKSIPKQTEKKSSGLSSSSSSKSSVEKSKIDVKRQKKSSDETGLAKFAVTPAKKVSADDTTVAANNAVKTESKNQRRKRERKEQNKLVNA